MGTAQAYLAAIVESSDDAILSKNLDGIMQSCNARRLLVWLDAPRTGNPADPSPWTWKYATKPTRIKIVISLVVGST